MDSLTEVCQEAEGCKGTAVPWSLVVCQAGTSGSGSAVLSVDCIESLEV